MSQKDRGAERLRGSGEECRSVDGRMSNWILSKTVSNEVCIYFAEQSRVYRDQVRGNSTSSLILLLFL